MVSNAGWVPCHDAVCRVTRLAVIALAAACAVKFCFIIFCHCAVQGAVKLQTA